MKKLVYFIVSAFFLTQSCSQKKEAPKELGLNTENYESALDVPVNTVGVLLNIDSIGFFDHNSQNLDQNISSKPIEDQLKQLNSKFDIVKTIRDKSVEILKDNKYTYQMIDKYDKKLIPNELITQENINQVNFNDLKKSINQDDLILINVKPGFDYDPSNKQKYIAKTYVYINILDLKNKVLKYSETIGGTKYIDETINKSTTAYLEEMMKESLNQTLEIIDKKY
ncbi:hypothetical protein [Empedobacter brevis]|uniref:hypothetical protein n=1 Tax=Empedobacter brevis TaxID=247 RepID=UPI0039AF536D